MRERHWYLNVGALGLALALLAGCGAPAPAEETPPASAAVQSQTPAPAESTPAESTPAAESAPRALTAEEIARVNDLFDWSGEHYDLAASQLFSSHYADVTEMDLDSFLYYYPDDGGVAFSDTAELDALRGHVEDLDTLMEIVPCHRILRTSVDETLKQYAGITTAEVETMGDALYVPEYDAFYSFASDWGPGFFTCEGGEVTGDAAVLWGKSGSGISYISSGEGVQDRVGLKKEDGQWHIKSHLKVPTDPTASLEAALLALEAGDIEKADAWDRPAPEGETLARLIRAGAQNILWGYYRDDPIAADVVLTLSGGRSLVLEAYEDGKTVGVTGLRNLPQERVYLSAPALCELVAGKL